MLNHINPLIKWWSTLRRTNHERAREAINDWSPIYHGEINCYIFKFYWVELIIILNDVNL